jgi:hypothetical protein
MAASALLLARQPVDVGEVDLRIDAVVKEFFSIESIPPVTAASPGLRLRVK